MRRTSSCKLWLLQSTFYIKPQWFRATSEKEAEFLFCKQLFQWLTESWQTNIDIQLVFTDYKIVTGLRSDFSKSEEQYSQTMKEAGKEPFETNLHYYEAKKCSPELIYINVNALFSPNDNSNIFEKSNVKCT